MKISWSLLAIDDRNAIFDFIEADNPRAAVMLDDRISEHVTQLTAFPESGRTGRVYGTRELVISHTPYIAVYSIQEILYVSCAFCMDHYTGLRAATCNAFVPGQGNNHLRLKASFRRGR